MGCASKHVVVYQKKSYYIILLYKYCISFGSKIK